MFIKLLSAIAVSTVFGFSCLAHALPDESFIGVGIVVEEKDKSIQIVDVLENSPASRNGIMPNEWLTAVDGNQTEGKKLKEVVSWIKGDEGSKVTLYVSNEYRAPSRAVELTREKIVVKCFLSGPVNLTFYSTGDNSGTLSGWIGDESVNWNVSFGQISGYFNGEYISRLDFATNRSADLQINGWIHSTYVNWYGYNNQIYTSQSCIR